MKRPSSDPVDTAAIRSFKDAYGRRASQLPPVIILIAAFNEARAISDVIRSLPKSTCGLRTRTIVVSDGSQDATVSEASAAGALVCDVPVNRGQGAALRLGYKLARDGGASFIVTFDGDGQYSPADIPRILRPVVDGTADFVSGSRKLGSEETKDLVRRLGVWVFARSIRLLTGQRVTDPSFGLRAMKADVTRRVQLVQPQYQAAELLISVISHGYRVSEVPASIHRRTFGSSKKGRNAYYGLRFAGVILRTWWRERQ